MYTKLSIPERLKDLQVVDKHLTLEQLAEQTGLSKSALGKYESAPKRTIRWERIRAGIFCRQTGRQKNKRCGTYRIK